ncbi:MAG TPA: peroxiredoxin [Patescibacteria group bacterium]|nr:peroxiredoxin [Patescibacteria group bacterium]
MKKADAAPDFTLPDEMGRNHKLSDYRGDWVLLYFYPKDFTPGCIKEACSLRDNFEKLKGVVKILGVSADSVKSHKKFSEKYSLPFTLLSDSDRKVINLYGATGVVFAKRVSFLINSKGVIEKIYDKVDPKVHADQILSDLSETK